VLVADQRMPGMTGVQLIEVVRGEFPDVLRMLMTAYSDLDAAIDAINLGRVQRYIQKPWEPVQLLSELTQARDLFLSRRRLSELERRLVSTERVYALGVIAAGIAHEIRNPLSALPMDLDLAQMLLAEAPGPSELTQTRSTLSDAQHAVGSIKDITESVELSTRERQDGPVDLKEIVELACRSVRGEMRRRGRIELKLSAVPKVQGSPTRLGQVVLNLLVNALEAMDPAKRTTNLASIELGESAGHVVLAVTDNGPGIEPGVLEHVFDPFFTTKRQGGTGLGLAISKTIVTELGGALEVQSSPGQGTRFWVRLPALGKAV
jgi:signal transduction histidine kinase